MLITEVSKLNCLSCGDCCKGMSPFGNPCPYIIEIETFVFCKIYDRRPKQCQDHTFPASKCPIGLDVLKIQSAEQYRIRMDAAWEYIKRGLDRSLKV